MVLDLRLGRWEVGRLPSLFLALSYRQLRYRNRPIPAIFSQMPLSIFHITSILKKTKRTPFPRIKTGFENAGRDSISVQINIEQKKTLQKKPYTTSLQLLIFKTSFLSKKVD